MNKTKNFINSYKISIFWIGLISAIIVILLLFLTYYTDVENIIFFKILASISSLLFSISVLITAIPFFIKEGWALFKNINARIRFSNYQGTYWADPNKVGLPKGPQLSDHLFQKIKDERKRIEAFADARVEYEEQDFKEWKRHNIGVNLDHTRHGIIRVLCVLVFAAFSFGIFILMGWVDYIQADSLAKLSESDVSRGFFTIPAALISTIIAAPIVFIIWFFRDHNNRIQIENSRKDTNLKDFQKLCEWASGLHLPENKVTETSKTTTKFVSDGDTKETLTEQNNSVEKSEIPTKSDHFTRRTGSEALQNSAIAQLEAFMYGKYGQQFMEPTFKLIYNLFVSFNPNIDNGSGHLSFRIPPNGLNSEILRTISNALTGKNGEHIRLFKENLIGSNLKSINSGFNNAIRLNISGLSLINSIFRSANFENANCVNCDFSYSHLNYATFENSDCQNSTFNSCDFYKTKISETKFQLSTFGIFTFSNIDATGTNFSLCTFHNGHIQNSSFTGCNFFDVDTMSIIIKNTSFRRCNFTNSNFESTNFQECIFQNCTLNRHTWFNSEDTLNYQMIESILLQSGIWDDDPQWLVGKIKNEELLERIRKDHAQRLTSRKTKNKDWDAY